MIRRTVLRFAATAALFAAGDCCLHAQDEFLDGCCDAPVCDSVECDTLDECCDAMFSRENIACTTLQDRLPSMIGDFFAGPGARAVGDYRLDRVFVFANDLDAPATLPPGTSTLMISESGPVGIYASSLASVQEAQAILRAGGTFPAASLAGTIAGNATLTTVDTISQIQAQLASTAQAYDIILLQPPPGTYDTGVQAAFQSRNALTGTTVFNANASGAMLQGGTDSMNGGEDFDAYYFYDYLIRFDTALPSVANGGVGSMKIAEGGSVLPQDRVFFNYSFFDDVVASNASSSLNRFTPGFEKTFLDGQVSAELRIPFATDAVSDFNATGTAVSNGSSAELGNIMLYVKALLYGTETYALTGGVGFGFSTADDIAVDLADGTPLLRVENDAVQIQPFLGWLYMPSEKWFAQGFTQFSFSTDENDVWTNFGQGLQAAGSFDDPDYYFFDVALGCWAYRNDDAACLTGIIPTVEVHHSNSLDNDASIVTAGNIQVGNWGGTTSLTSAVVGTTFEFKQQAQLTAGYAVPLTSSDRQYDGAFRMQYTRLLR
ncbi:hypothetical protein NZK35_22020 [Stieleria sp. ICT_E10.1]|uniref:hypothetical protein n=1 Tax=Stieleria sedimenti TaxID=2976331 RepID=UPI00217FC489|nr:hypothetical protein [Stieleria sedimenti]MCS7469337.1 hypothetical protein [Stieleria sedimenti]